MLRSLFPELQGFHPVEDEEKEEQQDDHKDRDHGPQNGKDSETVRNGLKSRVCLQLIYAQPNLHGREHDHGVHRRRCQPGKLIPEEGLVLLPMRQIWLDQWRPACEAVELVKTREAELSVLESLVDLVVYAFRVYISYQANPCGPCYLFWEQGLFFCDSKVALVGDQRGVREEEAKSTCPESSVTVSRPSAPVLCV